MASTTTATTENGGTFDDALDRLMGKDNRRNGDEPMFIPTPTFQGSKPGYVFRTSKEHGTGYHLDSYQQGRMKSRKGSTDDNTSQQQQQPPPPTTGSSSSNSSSRKRARFDISQNETRVIEATSNNNKSNNSLSGEELLQQAEAAADPYNKIIELSPKGLQSAIRALHKAVQRNSMQRAQYADDPEQYMESELALYEHIQAFNGIAAAAKELYPLLIVTKNNNNKATRKGEHNGTSSKINNADDLWTDMTQLLSHENQDVALSVSHVLVEWLDPTLEDGTTDESDNEETSLFVTALAREVVQSSCLDLMVANLGRIRDVTKDREGVEDILTIAENLIELELAQGVVDGEFVKAIASTPLISWLFEQLSSSSSSSFSLEDTSTGGRTWIVFRSTELLALLFQQSSLVQRWNKLTEIAPYSSSLVEEDTTSSDDKKQKLAKKAHDKKPSSLDGLEIVLQAMAKFRKKQPANEEQVDFLENLCTALASALTFAPSTNVPSFLEAQGVELVLRCLRERVHAGGVGLVLLDIRTMKEGPAMAERLIEAGGLKLLFPLWMQQNLPKAAVAATSALKQQQSNKREWKRRMEVTMIHIMFHWTRYLPSRSESQARFLVKFRSDNATKCHRLVELLLKYDQKVRMAEYKYYHDKEEDDEEHDEELEQAELLLAKEQGGGDLFHRLGAIAAFLCVHSKACHEAILEKLTKEGSGISVVSAAVNEFLTVLPSDDDYRQLLVEYKANI